MEKAITINTEELISLLVFVAQTTPNEYWTKWDFISAFLDDKTKKEISKEVRNRYKQAKKRMTTINIYHENVLMAQVFDKDQFTFELKKRGFSTAEISNAWDWCKESDPWDGVYPIGRYEILLG